MNDARQAIKAHLKFRETGKRALAWWGEHCHATSESDSDVSAAAFTCDTQRGRPPGLTAAKIREYMSDRDIAFYERRLKEDQQCIASDPISLDLMGLDTDVFGTSLDEILAEARRSGIPPNPRQYYSTFARIVEVRCFETTSSSCSEDEQRVDDLRKKVETFEARNSTPAPTQ